MRIIKSLKISICLNKELALYRPLCISYKSHHPSPIVDKKRAGFTNSPAKETNEEVPAAPAPSKPSRGRFGRRK